MNKKTHQVLDLHYTKDECQGCFAGTLQECEDFAATQSPYFMYRVVLLTKEEYELENSIEPEPAPHQPNLEAPNKGKERATINKSLFVENMEKIYCEIQSIQAKPTDTFQSLIDKFYSVMRKWGVCHGNWSENGRTAVSAEWNMCFNVFWDNVVLGFRVWVLLTTPPDDLLAYGEEPKRNNK